MNPALEKARSASALDKQICSSPSVRKSFRRRTPRPCRSREITPVVYFIFPCRGQEKGLNCNSNTSATVMRAFGRTNRSLVPRPDSQRWLSAKGLLKPHGSLGLKTAEMLGTISVLSGLCMYPVVPRNAPWPCRSITPGIKLPLNKFVHRHSSSPLGKRNLQRPLPR